MATTNLLEALIQTQTDAHVIHLGSIGVYGYETLGYEVPEGYQKVRHMLTRPAILDRSMRRCIRSIPCRNTT